MLQIGIKLLDIIEKVHRAGVVFNDLKMDNIMVANNDRPAENLVLIDFGLASRFKGENGEHIPQYRS